MIRIDMSEYMERHTVSRLIGAPPGYVGYEEGGQLTEAVRRKPYSVVLLDEIEKAHPEVFNVLLQVLDDGRLTDNQGRTVNFTNTILIMTSNIGATYIMERSGNLNDKNSDEIYEDIKREVTQKLRDYLRPEFLNRIDEIVVFHPLTMDDIKKIVDLQMKLLYKKLVDQGIEISLSPEARDYLARAGYDPAFGARPLKRVMQKQLSNPLANRILAGEFKKGDRIRVDVKENSLDFSTKDA